MTLTTLEEERIEILKEFDRYRANSLVFTPIILAFIYFLFYKYVGYSSVAEISAFERIYLIVSFLFFYAFSYNRSLRNKKEYLSKRFRQKFKSEYLRPYIKKVGHFYNMYENLGTVDIVNSGLFKPFTHQKGNDFISGIKNGVRFKFSDIVLEDRIDTWDITQFVEFKNTILAILLYALNLGKFRYKDGKIHLFTGLLFMASFNKNISSNTFIMQESTPKDAYKLKTIRMDNAEFNAKFRVYTDDIQNAMYLLSPALMEKILKLSKRFKKPINISFIKSKIYIAIDTKTDNFEPSLDKNIKKHNPAKMIMRDLDAMFEIVEALNLDNTLFQTKF